MSNRAPAPELIDLPVYRDDYISQQQVDLLCRILWDEKPSSVEEFTEEEKSMASILIRRNPVVINAISNLLHRISEFFREKEGLQNIEKISYTGMVDLIYEVERRIRVAIGLGDFFPVGHPIAPSPEGPFPENGDIYFHILKDEDYYKEFPSYVDGRKEPALPPARNAVYKMMCKEHPEMVFADAEALRRYQDGGELYWLIQNYLKKHLDCRNE